RRQRPFLDGRRRRASPEGAPQDRQRQKNALSEEALSSQHSAISKNQSAAKSRAQRKERESLTAIGQRPRANSQVLNTKYQIPISTSPRQCRYTDVSPNQTHLIGGANG